MIRLLLPLLLIAPSPANAVDTAERELARIVGAVEKELAFEGALERLSRLLERSDLTLEQRTRAYALAGVCHTALGDQARAETAYLRLLMLSPEYVLEEGQSPKVNAIFERAKARWQKIAPRLSLDAPEVKEGRLSISAHVVDPERLVSQLLLYSRSGRDDPYLPHTFSSGEQGFTIELPLDPHVEYYGVAVGAAEQALASAGDAHHPLTHTTVMSALAPEPPEERWYEKWWVWTAIGVVVAGSAVAVGVAATSGGDPDPIFTIHLPAQ